MNVRAARSPSSPGRPSDGARKRAAAGRSLLGGRLADYATLLRAPGGRFGLAVLAGLVTLGVLAPILAPYNPLAISQASPLAAPSGTHLFGTDDLGRDVLSRVIFGARISLTVACSAALTALVIAVPLGLLAGYRGGAIDVAITRLFDTVYAFPDVLLGIGLVTMLGANLANVVLAVAVVNVPTLGRLTRVAVLAQRDEEYVEAARAVGASDARMIARHLLPNVVPPLLVQVTVVMSQAVLLEAAFSFLGLGIRPPAPSWGTMLNDGREFLAQAPWLGVFPGLAITTMILGLNALGDALRIALNPRRR